MKIEELMLDNWVMPDQCRIPTIYCKVEGIYPDRTVSLDKAERLFSEEKLHSVLLTPEILEKNGWIEASGYWVLKGHSTRLGWKHGEMIVGFSALPEKIFYVHELQNLMKAVKISCNFEI